MIEETIERLFIRLDNADAPDAQCLIETIRKKISQSPEQEKLKRKYEPILKIYEREYHLSSQAK